MNHPNPNPEEHPMKYMLLIYDAESKWESMSKSENDAMMAEYFKYTEDLKNAKVLIAGEALKPISAATTVRVREGKAAHLDGPFAETKEQLGGFYLLDVANLDEALKWAAKCPSARIGGIEVRPLQIYG
jgi:hypothetical protein